MILYLFLFSCALLLGIGLVKKLFKLAVSAAILTAAMVVVLVVVGIL